MYIPTMQLVCTMYTHIGQLVNTQWLKGYLQSRDRVVVCYMYVCVHAHMHITSYSVKKSSQTWTKLLTVQLSGVSSVTPLIQVPSLSMMLFSLSPTTSDRLMIIREIRRLL